MPASVKPFFLTYSKFGKYKVSFPVKWDADPFSNRNWRHNFVSLRWLKNHRDEGFRLAVLEDFYDFHVVRRKKNPYYSELRGDHTMAIRTSELLLLVDNFKQSAHEQGIAICEKLVKAEILNMSRPAVYRSGHNHGLMLDMALLRCGLAFPDLAVDVDVAMVVERAMKTLQVMFMDSGYTKEHSASYQVFNAALAVDCVLLLKSYGVKSPAFESFVIRIAQATETLARFFVRSSGECFPIGDSFRVMLGPQFEKVMQHLGRSVPLDADFYGAPWQVDTNESLHVRDSFAALRYASPAAGRWHLFFSCGWHSHNHKQNDEMAFCLEVDGQVIIDEVGYTEFVPWEMVLEHQKETLQSNFSLIGLPWTDSKLADGTSQILYVENRQDEFSIAAEHQRMPGFIASRVLAFNKINQLRIIDRLNTITGKGFSQELEHRFVMSPDLELRLQDGYVVIAWDKIDRMQLRTDRGRGRWFLRDVPYVTADRTVVSSTKMLVFVAITDCSQSYVETEFLLERLAL
ncbi:heparinase II/III family protein [Alcaligenes faecalis]|uniref:heparinase II/III domain-containing protein n=1 Tax=Alcaligenes faecalis TaxID=511 RepID=UPI001B3675DD|nr:heparinase II/III family protein [Alcaligenes faecalis]MBQ0217151.1 heparinase II/III family protein [Alcaligenes faecalis]